jgi:hypothetical protein
MSMPETEVPKSVPELTFTVKYPGSKLQRLGADQPAGIVIFSVP